MFDWMTGVFSFMQNMSFGGVSIIAVIVLVLVCKAIGIIIKGNK